MHILFYSNDNKTKRDIVYIDVLFKLISLHASRDSSCTVTIYMKDKLNSIKAADLQNILQNH